MPVILLYIFAWFGLLVLAIINAAGREYLYAPFMSDYVSHQISIIPAVALFLGYTWLLERLRPIPDYPTACLIGAVWVALTVAFEFFMVIVLQGKPLREAFAQYNLAAGEFWPVLLIALFFIPVAVVRLRS